LACWWSPPPPVANGITYTSKTATFLKIPSPGVLSADSDPNGLPLQVVISSVTPTGVTINMDPQGGFTASAPGAGTYTFTYLAQNSQGRQSASATVTLIFPQPSNLKVNVLDAQAYNNCNGNSACISTLVPFSDYRWIIEEDKTFWVDPNCTTNSSISTPGCPTIVGPAGQSSIPVFGVQFHTSNMDFVAQGCTGPLSCEGGQTFLNPATGTHDPAVCDVGNGACRPDTTGNGFTAVLPGQVALDPSKRYYISVLPGDAANPFPSNGGIYGQVEYASTRPFLLTQCMNDPGPVLDTNPGSPTYGQMVQDPLYNPAYSDFCYEEPYMPGLTAYLDTPVVPTEGFVGAAYDDPNCSYPDATPAIKEVDGDGIGPWVSAAGKTLTITALGAVQVSNSAYSGPSANTAPFNLKTVGRHYGFGTQCTAVAGSCVAVSSVTIGGIAAPVTSWSDTSITVTVPAGVPNCAIQQQKQYGGSAAQCGQLVITAGNGKQSIDTVTVTIGGKAPTHVSANQTIQSAIDAAAPGDLIIVDPTCTTTGTTTLATCSTASSQTKSAAAHNEMLLMWKPVRLQGVGAVSSIIDANAFPAGKLLDPWHGILEPLIAKQPDLAEPRVLHRHNRRGYRKPEPAEPRLTVQRLHWDTRPGADRIRPMHVGRQLLGRRRPRRHGADEPHRRPAQPDVFGDHQHHRIWLYKPQYRQSELRHPVLQRLARAANVQCGGWVRRPERVWRSSGNRRCIEPESGLQSHSSGDGGRGQQLDQRELGSAGAEQRFGDRRDVWELRWRVCVWQLRANGVLRRHPCRDPHD
jgi:hypothetical protein